MQMAQYAKLGHLQLQKGSLVCKKPTLRTLLTCILGLRVHTESVFGRGVFRTFLLNNESPQVFLNVNSYLEFQETC